jgi:hypothetical protein
MKALRLFLQVTTLLILMFESRTIHRGWVILSFRFRLVSFQSPRSRGSVIQLHAHRREQPWVEEDDFLGLPQWDRFNPLPRQPQKEDPSVGEKIRKSESEIRSIVQSELETAIAKAKKSFAAELGAHKPLPNTDEPAPAVFPSLDFDFTQTSSEQKQQAKKEVEDEAVSREKSKRVMDLESLGHMPSAEDLLSSPEDLERSRKSHENDEKSVVKDQILYLPDDD